MKSTNHISVLDPLRGLAALAVAFFHFSGPMLPSTEGNYFFEVAKYGKYGVQAFFVISGFVIPYSLDRSKYVIQEFPKWISRRFVRLAPPAYMAILLVIVFYFGGFYYLGRPINGMVWPGINWLSVMANITFTVPFLDTQWFNPVFWTLAIEFQFYILIGCLFPLVYHSKYSFILCSLAMMLIGFFPVEWYFRYSSYFVLGLALFGKEKGTLSGMSYYFLVICALISGFWVGEIPGTLIGFSTFLIISNSKEARWGGLNFLGKISFSLYITHTIVGALSEIVFSKLIMVGSSNFIQTIMVLVYVIIAVIAASVFYQIIEKPFLLASKKVAIKN